MTAIRLWRHNRNDGGWEIEAAELAERYAAWRGARRDGDFVRDLASFVAADEADGGLASVTDPELPVDVLALEVWPYVKDLWSQ